MYKIYCDREIKKRLLMRRSHVALIFAAGIAGGYWTAESGGWPPPAMASEPVQPLGCAEPAATPATLKLDCSLSLPPELQ